MNNSCAVDVGYLVNECSDHYAVEVDPLSEEELIGAADLSESGLYFTVDSDFEYDRADDICLF